MLIGSDKFKSTFSTFEATQPTQLDISKAFSKKHYGVVLDRNLSQKCVINAGVFPVSILGKTNFLVNVFPGDNS